MDHEGNELSCLSQDFHKLLLRFQQTDDVSFRSFRSIWIELGFSFIQHCKPEHLSPSHFNQLLHSIALGYLFVNRLELEPRRFSIRLGILYALYVLYEILLPKTNIVVPLVLWKELRLLKEEIKSHSLMDAFCVFHKLQHDGALCYSALFPLHCLPNAKIPLTSTLQVFAGGNSVVLEGDLDNQSPINALSKSLFNVDTLAGVIDIGAIDVIASRYDCFKEMIDISGTSHMSFSDELSSGNQESFPSSTNGSSVSGGLRIVDSKLTATLRELIDQCYDQISQPIADHFSLLNLPNPEVVNSPIHRSSSSNLASTLSSDAIVEGYERIREDNVMTSILGMESIASEENSVISPICNHSVYSNDQNSSSENNLLPLADTAWIDSMPREANGFDAFSYSVPFSSSCTTTTSFVPMLPTIMNEIALQKGIPYTEPNTQYNLNSPENNNQHNKEIIENADANDDDDNVNSSCSKKNSFQKEEDLIEPSIIAQNIKTRRRKRKHSLFNSV